MHIFTKYRDSIRLRIMKMRMCCASVCIYCILLYLYRIWYFTLKKNTLNISCQVDVHKLHMQVQIEIKWKKKITNRFKREKIHPYKLLTNCQFVTFVIVYLFVIRNWNKFLVISQTTWSGKVNSGDKSKINAFWLSFKKCEFLCIKWKRFFYLKPNWNRWESFLIFRFLSTEMNLMWMDQIICTQDFRAL